MAVAVSDVTSRSVKVALDLLEAGDQGVVTKEETIGYIAMEPGHGYLERFLDLFVMSFSTWKIRHV